MKVSITFEFDSEEEAAAALADGIGGVAQPAAPAKPDKPKKAAKKPAKAAKKEPEPGPEDDEDGVTIDTLRETFQALVKVGKRPDALKLLKKYGVSKIHEVSEDDMAAMYNDAIALAGETEEEDDDNDLGI